MKNQRPLLCMYLSLGILVILLFGCGRQSISQGEGKPRFVRQIDWIGKGTWVKADTHMHTTFSDGSHRVEDVVLKAKTFGCQVVAITDHADHDRQAATPAYHEAIEVARRLHPNMVILAGLEWNVPPYGGKEHATVLFPSEMDERSILARFKARFDDYERKEHKPELAEAALRWLEKNASKGDVKPVVIYNHPSRKDNNSMENVADLLQWRKVNDLVIGFSGSPGHQGSKTLGSYRYKVKTIDRWDPMAEVGDGWDTLLQKGVDLWGARADSDFHNANPKNLNDYWPGQFSETWLYVPEKSARGVLRAFRAGSFFAAHGHIVRQVAFTVEAEGLPRPAYPGEVVELGVGTPLTVKLRCVVPKMDWEGKPNHLDKIELIAITPDAMKIVASRPLTADGSVTFDPLEVPSGGIVFRARGRRVVASGPDLLFYTNPIRIKVAN